MRVKRHVGSDRYLKAEMIGPNKAVTVEILRVVLEQVRDGQRPVMYFSGRQRGLVLNVENANVLSEIFGTDESDVWLGQRIELYTTMVKFGAKDVLGIRVRRARTSSGQAPPRREPGEDDPAAGDPVDRPLHAADMRW